MCCRIGVNALSNEFLTNACNEWRERLSEGAYCFVYHNFNDFLYSFWRLLFIFNFNSLANIDADNAESSYDTSHSRYWVVAFGWWLEQSFIVLCKCAMHVGHWCQFNADKIMLFLFVKTCVLDWRWGIQFAWFSTVIPPIVEWYVLHNRDTQTIKSNYILYDTDVSILKQVSIYNICKHCETPVAARIQYYLFGL